MLAIPFIHYQALPADLLADKIVLDATNYYPDRDGQIPQLDGHETTTSQMMAKHLAHSRVVKVFNAILARDIVRDATPFSSVKKRALPVAADDHDAKDLVFDLVEQTGFDYVDGGTLAESWRFERAKPAYCIPLNKEQMINALNNAVRDVELPHNSWHIADDLMPAS